MRLTRSEQGSLTVALLVAIVTAGLIVALTASVMQSHDTVRFDRSFTQAVQVADAGVQDAYHRLSSGQIPEIPIGDISATYQTGLGSDEANWQLRRLDSRSYEVRSSGAMSADGVVRTVVASIDEQSLFFPGAFGDRLVAMNGTSTNVDSYESETSNCASNSVEHLCWGSPAMHPAGTRRAALGTNENFDFSGNPNVSRAILYDWAENKPASGTITAGNPGGSRCEGNPCTADVLRMVDEPLDYGSEAEMAFIREKLEDCDGRMLPSSVLGSKHTPGVLEPQSVLPAANASSPAEADWDNYWCADSLQVNGDIELVGASPETPVVIFIRESYKQNGHTIVNCPECVELDLNMNDMADVRRVRPKAASLQIYVLSEAPNSGANILIDQHSVFAGVVYAPRAACGSSGNAGVDVYGSMICRRIDNVGNWEFHYDDALSKYGRGIYDVASWREE